MFCPSCGFRNREGGSFCARCGASLFQDLDEPQTTVSYAPDEDTSETPPPREALLEGASLVVRSGGGRAGDTFTLLTDQVTVGRHPDSTIFLDDVTVSRNHAVLLHEGEDWYIVDKGSLNGTYVNRKRVERLLLSDGDELQIGKYKLTFIRQ